MSMKTALFALLVVLVTVGCRLDAETDPGVSPTATTDGLVAPEDSVLRALLAQYTTVRLDADLSGLSDSTRRMIPYLIEAAKAMDEVFWTQAYGERDSLLASLDSEAARRYARINYGPWDRLDGNAPFLPGAEAKPPAHEPNHTRPSRKWEPRRRPVPRGVCRAARASRRLPPRCR